MPELKKDLWWSRVFGTRVPLPQFKKKSDGSFNLLEGEKGVFVQVVDGTAQKAVSVTPNDTTNLSGGATKGIYIGGTGNISVTMADGTDVVFTALSSGMIHPISVLKVKATGTTATNIVAVY